MTPWHSFWFPHGDEAPTPTRDAALWTPQAIADSQRELWRQASEAAEEWWRYWRAAWPGVPMQPPAGVVVPPAADESPPPAATARVAHAPARRKAAAAVKPAARSAGSATAKPRHGARGK